MVDGDRSGGGGGGRKASVGLTGYNPECPCSPYCGETSPSQRSGWFTRLLLKTTEAHSKNMRPALERQKIMSW